MFMSARRLVLSTDCIWCVLDSAGDTVLYRVVQLKKQIQCKDSKKSFKTVLNILLYTHLYQANESFSLHFDRLDRCRSLSASRLDGLHLYSAIAARCSTLKIPHSALLM